MPRRSSTGINGTRWAVQYRWRMDNGLERCRGPECEAATKLTFDHIYPYAAGGTLRLDNTTILCERHQQLKGHSTAPPWCDIPSLAAEEAAAPLEERWSRQPVPEEVVHRLRKPRKKANQAAAALRTGEPWRNESWTAQLATLSLEER